MASILWRRDVSTDVQDVESTFSSWDKCMSEPYCKWPAIVGIIIAALIVLSIVSCLVRCLCCGLECCCGCFACCNACCPSPRRSRRDRQFKSQPPGPQPYQSYPTYNQYQPPVQPPVYASGGLGYNNTPQFASFDVSRSPQPTSRINEDALPAMPSWDAAPTRRIEEEDVEMDRLEHPQSAQQHLLSSPHSGANYYNPIGGGDGDLGAISARPYYDYNQQRSDTSYNGGGSSVYNQSYRSPEPSHTPYAQTQHQYVPSIPPSYHTYEPAYPSTSPVSAAQTPQYPRRPVQGSWRDV